MLTKIHAIVEGSYCRSGAPPVLDDPLISLGADRVVIGAVENPPKGFHTCEGTPPVEFTFELEEPIGNRVVLDAKSFPFEERFDFRP